MAVPTSALTFDDLVLEVALFLGTASYGVGGNGAAVIPTDAHDLAEARRHVNNGIRMFFANPPRTGWRFARPVGTFTIFPKIEVSDTNTVTAGAYDAGNDETILTANTNAFYPGHEFRVIVVTTVDTFEIKRYIGPTQVAVYGDASAVAANTYSIDTNGAFTLPADFHGEYTGAITYTSDTNQGVSLAWTNEAVIRQWREDITDETGDPYWASVAVMPGANARANRRWELLMYPQPDEVMTVQFPYEIHFNELVNGADVPPTPVSHDETIRAACLAAAERDTDDNVTTHHQNRFRDLLSRSYEKDNRTGPRKLGYFGDGGMSAPNNVITNFRDNLYDRPTVRFNP
jgi:hypothetical protein